MNLTAFLSELPAVALHGALFTGVTFTVWLCFQKQSAARASVCGRLIIAAALILFTAGTFTVWQRHQVPAEASLPQSTPLTEAPLPSEIGRAHV